MSSNRPVLLGYYAVDDIEAPTSLGGVANFFYHPVLRARNHATPAKLEVWSQTDKLLPLSRQIAAELDCAAFMLAPELDTFAQPGGMASRHPLWERIFRHHLHIVVIVAASDFVQARRPAASVSDTCMLKRWVTVSSDGTAQIQP